MSGRINNLKIPGAISGSELIYVAYLEAEPSDFSASRKHANRPTSDVRSFAGRQMSKRHEVFMLLVNKIITYELKIKQVGKLENGIPYQL